MATNKQKSKKKKGVPMTWQEFMKDSTLPIQTGPSWADEMENQNNDDEMETVSAPTINRATLPTAPRAARGMDIDESKIPNQPPYQAYIGNLPFDVSDEDIRRFFKNLTVVSTKLQTDASGRFRGFGYIEFETRQMLIDSMSFSNLPIKNREIRVDLATQSQGGEREKRDDFHKRGQDDGEDRTSSDWRKKDDKAPSDRPFRRSEDENDRSSGNQRGYSNRNNYGDKRENDGYFDRNRGGYGGRQQQGYGRDGFQNRDRYERRDDRSDNYGSRDNNFGSRDNNFGSRDSNFGSRDNRSFDRRRDFESSQDFERKSEAREDGWRQRSDANRDSSWKRDGSRDGPRMSMANRRRDDDDKDKEAGEKKFVEPSVPKERPRLNLIPRTRPIEETQQVVANSTIFGGAKPVDTSQREREIEEKMKRMNVQKSSDEERRVSQSSDDTVSTKKKVEEKVTKPEDSQPIRKEKPAQATNQRVKGDSECSEEPQQPVTTPTPSQTAVKVVPAPAPKVNYWEARRNNQQPAPVTREVTPAVREVTPAVREVTPVVREVTPETSTSTSKEDVSSTTTTTKDDAKASQEQTTKVPQVSDCYTETSKSHPVAKDDKPDPHKSNVWEARTKERETKQKPEAYVRRTAVSVGNAMRGRGSFGQRGSNRREEPVTAVVSVKQKQRERPVSYENMMKLEEKSQKDWSVKNKFSSLMDDDDDDDDDESITVPGDEDNEEDTDAKNSNHSNGSKRVASYKKTEIQECV